MGGEVCKSGQEEGWQAGIGDDKTGDCIGMDFAILVYYFSIKQSQCHPLLNYTADITRRIGVVFPTTAHLT